MKKISFLILVTFFAFACNRPAEQKQIPVVEEKQEVRVAAPTFNADSAFSFLKKQVDFGPRVPNTNAHIKCGDYLIAQMEKYCDTVYVQSGIVTAYDQTKLKFRNIIGAINPAAKNRVLLFAHWDTRPWADQDKNDPRKPALGADDGASGIATLMELARIMHDRKPSIGVDLAFFDAEDWGKEGGGENSEDSYALGTQYWTKQPHLPNYTAMYGILLDMTGGKNAQFRYEGYSKQYAPFVLQKVWTSAINNGYGQYFLNADAGWVIDDHMYVNRMNIPSIDIISSDPTQRSGFPKHWHTHDDNLDIIDTATLKAVGQTLADVIYNER